MNPISMKNSSNCGCQEFALCRVAHKLFSALEDIVRRNDHDSFESAEKRFARHRPVVHARHESI